MTPAVAGSGTEAPSSRPDKADPKATKTDDDAEPAPPVPTPPKLPAIATEARWEAYSRSYEVDGGVPGFRLEHEPTGHAVELRLVGKGKAEPVARHGVVRFRPQEGVSVVYERIDGGVKESIVLRRSDLSRFEFALSAPGLTPRWERHELALDAPEMAGMFRIGAVKAWDATGAEVGVSQRLVGGRIRVSLSRADLRDAVLPVTVDPTVVSGEVNSTSGTARRPLVRTSDGELFYFFRCACGADPKVSYVRSTDDGETWSSRVDLGPAGSLTDVSAFVTDDDDILVAYSAPDIAGVTIQIKYQVLTKSGSAWSATAAQRVSGAAEGGGLPRDPVTRLVRRPWWPVGS